MTNHLRYLPTFSKVLVRFTKPERAVLIPESSGDPAPDIFVLSIGPDVTCCKPGDRILPRPDCNIHTLETDDRTALCLIDSSAIVAIDLGPDISLAG